MNKELLKILKGLIILVEFYHDYEEVIWDYEHKYLEQNKELIDKLGITQEEANIFINTVIREIE